MRNLAETGYMYHTKRDTQCQNHKKSNKKVIRYQIIYMVESMSYRAAQLGHIFNYFGIGGCYLSLKIF